MSTFTDTQDPAQEATRVGVAMRGVRNLDAAHSQP